MEAEEAEREVRTAFFALLRLEAAFINMRAFARARVKPNKRYACCLGLDLQWTAIYRMNGLRSRHYWQQLAWFAIQISLHWCA